MKLQSPVDKVVVTSVGHTLAFVANEPLHVPPAAVQDCLAKGCYLSKGEVLKPEEKEEIKVVQGEERNQAIIEAVKKLVARNGRDDFTGSGKPDIKALSELAGFKVFAKERDELWVEVAQEISEE